MNLSNVQIPLEVINAAIVIEKWTKENELRYWEMGVLCDRRFARKLDCIALEARNMLKAHGTPGATPELEHQQWRKQLELSLKDYKQHRGISN